MKYLVHLTAPEELSNKIKEFHSKGCIKDIIPYQFSHCTLFNLSCDEKFEPEIIESLENIKIEPFSTKTKNIDLFDGGSLVLRLDRNEQFLKLHYKILERVKRFSEKYDPTFYEFRYNPHLTLAKLGKDYVYIKPKLENIEFKIEEIDLSKKLQDWNIIKNFKLLHV